MANFENIFWYRDIRWITKKYYRNKESRWVTYDWSGNSLYTLGFRPKKSDLDMLIDSGQEILCLRTHNGERIKC